MATAMRIRTSSVRSSNPTVMFDRIGLLREIPLFSDLGSWDIQRISETAVIESFPRGRQVITEGARGDAFYVILSGRCRIHTKVKTGRERIFGYLRRGDSFGEVSLLTGEDYWASVSVTNDAVLLKIEKKDFDSILRKNPKLAIKFGESIGRQLQGVRVTQKEAKWSRLIGAYTPNLPDIRSVFSSSLAASLAQESNEPVCLIEFLSTAPAMMSVTRLGESLGRAQAGTPFQDLFARHPAGYRILALHIDDDAKGEKIFSELLDHLIRTFNYIVLDLPLAVGRTASRALSQCDRVYLLSDGSDESLKTTAHVGESFRREFLLKPEELKIVLCNMDHDARRSLSSYERKLGMAVETSFDVLPDNLRLTGIDGNPLVLAQPKNPFSRAVRHIARGLSNRLVGLALGVGAARGLAHIGVIRVLERENILIDMISGTSMGSFIGAIWAVGKNSHEMEEIANLNRGISALARNLFDPNIWPPFGFKKGGFIRGRKASAFLHRIIGDATFSDTLIPIKILATDINTYREVLFQEGRLVDAVRPSSAIPGIFEPVRMNDWILVDGGILNPLPVGPLVRAGVSKIIAVNTLPGPDDFPQDGKFAARPDGYENLTWGERFLKKLARNYSGNIFDVIMSSTQIMEYVLSENAREEADVVIRPVHRDAAWYEFNEAKKYITRGEEETEKALPEIRQALSGSV